MKPCLFCGKRENSDEHIIAHSVWARLQAGGAEIEVGVWDGAVEKDFRRPHRQESLITRAVCPACNKGWMSELEIAFLAAAGPLIEPVWRHDPEKLVNHVLLQGETVAKWAVKTAVTANSAGVVQRPIHPDIAHELRQGILPCTLRVFIGWIERRSIGITINQGFWFVEGSGSRRWKGPEQNRAFDVSFQLNHFAIRAIAAPHLAFVYRARSDSAPIPCYPPGSTWHSPTYTFGTMRDFEGELLALTAASPPTV